ncbi:MAG: ring-hydroxylating oxygenase subunit alpha [Alphaproteobacteria bacterium]|nr:ring-hydroxylating oxygenase subunit alpha [Alphaproteobacteria bacterium]
MSPKDKARTKVRPYSAYYRRETPAEDAELTHTDAGTPLGEYMRRFWQPVCLSSQLTDVPHRIRIMGEELVAFRDKSGDIGVVQRHCCHRGAGLEFAIIQKHGIRCCYHGFHFACDGTIIEVPGEADKGEKLRQSVSQGAYPAFERDGLVFAYMGPPETKPAFPNYDAFVKYGDTRLVPYTNVYDCNWLQVMDNIADQMHTCFLHNNMTQEGVEAPMLSLNPTFTKTPVMDYAEVRDGTAMMFIAGRRVDDTKVWIRMNDLIVPNITEHAYLYEDGRERRLFHRVHMARWYVPIDDTHCIIFGWRMFGDAIDPFRQGDESKCGANNIDFLDGQVNNRSFAEAQRAPGDWEAAVSQRPIAIHALENPMQGDIGVYLYRRILRNAIRGKTAAARPERMHERAGKDLPTHCYSSNTVLEIARRASVVEDEEMIRRLGRDVLAAVASGDKHVGEKRNQEVRRSLAALEDKYRLQPERAANAPAKKAPAKKAPARAAAAQRGGRRSARPVSGGR